jgi:hypothetical protein
MLQMAFDFYDTSNDEKISEFDLFKSIYYYGHTETKRHNAEMYQDRIQPDILMMLQLIVYLRDQLNNEGQSGEEAAEKRVS